MKHRQYLWREFLASCVIFTADPGIGAQELPPDFKNGPPSIQGALANQTVDDRETIRPFAGVTVTDREDFEGGMTVMVRLNKADIGGFSDLNGLTPGEKDFYAMTGSAEAITVGIQGMVFRPAPNRLPVGETDSVGFQIRALDPFAQTTVDNNASLIVRSVNDPPVIQGLSTLPPHEDQTLVRPFADIQITDVDAGDTFVRAQVVYNPNQGEWASEDGFDRSDGNSNEPILVTEGLLEEVIQRLDRLNFAARQNLHPVGLSETISFEILAWDGHDGASEPFAVQFDSVSANDAPSLTGVPEIVSIGDNESVRPYEFLSIVDPDPSPGEYEILLQAPFDSTEGVLELTDDFISNEDGSWRLKGMGFELEERMQTARFIPFNNLRPVGTAAVAPLRLSLRDSLGEGVEIRTEIHVNSVNDPPGVQGVQGPIQGVEGAALVPFAEAEVFDPDAASNFLTVTFRASPPESGVFEGGEDLLFNADGSATLAGSSEFVNPRLRELIFRPANNIAPPGFVSEVTLTLEVRDRLGARAMDDSLRVLVETVNDPPLISGARTLTITDKESALPFANIEISDPDIPNAFLTVRVTVENLSAGEVDFVEAFERDPESEAAWTFSGNADEAAEALRAFRFTPHENAFPAGGVTFVDFEIRAMDRDGLETVNSGSSLQVSSVNDPPSITGWRTQHATDENVPIRPFENVVVSDPDGADQLLTTALTLAKADTGVFLPAEGWIEEAPGRYGIRANAETTTRILNALQFDPADNRVLVTLTETTRWTLELEDSFGAGVPPLSADLVSRSVNDPPYVEGALGGQEISDKETVRPFATVRFLDPDLPPHFIFVTVEVDDLAKGSFDLLNGFQPLGGGAFEFYGTLEECNEAIQGMVFNPAENRSPAGEIELTRFTIRVRDRLGSQSVNEEASVASLSINDPARLISLTTEQIVDDDKFIHPFDGASLVDPDPQLGLLEVQLSQNLGAYARWENHRSWNSDSSGALRLRGTAPELEEALRALGLAPVPNRLPVGAIHSIQITAKVFEDSGEVGDEQAIVAHIQSVNDIPFIAGELAASNSAEVYFPFSSLTIEDGDVPADRLNVSLEIDPPQMGTFGGSFGFSKPEPGKFVFNGSAAAATQEIRRLIFVPLAPPDPDEIPAVARNDRDGDGRSNNEELEDGTDPDDINSFFRARLGLWRFNDRDYIEDGGLPPIQIVNARRGAGVDGSGVHISGASRAGLKYPAERPDGRPLVNARSGAVRFWFRPDWTSQSAGGSGPGDFASLIELGKWDTAAFIGWWSLQATPDGSFLRFDAQANGEEATYFVCPIQWRSNEWQEIVLCYHPGYTQLFVNDLPVITGSGMTHYPRSEAVLEQGLNVGGDTDGNFPARGVFDHLETYNYSVNDSETQIDRGFLSVTAQFDAPSFLLDWKNKGTEGFFIQKKRLADADWEILASDYRDWSFVDNDIEPGARYEYRIGERYAVAAWNAEPVESRGHVLVLVDDTLHSALVEELEQFERDLIGDGWTAAIDLAPRHDDEVWANNPPRIEEVKNRIVRESERPGVELKAILLVGHVAIPFSGLVNPDGHDYRTWAVDGYYGDLDQGHLWSDTKLLLATGVRNEPGDGRFDQNRFPSPIELAVGRVDFSRLPSLEAFEGGGFPEGYELRLIKKYFQRNHAYRHGVLRFNPQVAARGYYPPVLGALNDTIHARGWHYASKFFGGSTAGAIREDFFTLDIPSLWGELGGFGGPDAINCCGTTATRTTQQLALGEFQVQVAFFDLEGSFLGEWNREDNFMRTALATSDYALAALWARGYTPRYETLSLGDTIGEGFIKTVNDLNQFRLTPNIIVNLMGDPTLRIHVLDPPKNPGVSTSQGMTSLSWEGRDGNLYLVYRSDNGLDGPFERLNANPLLESTFDDPAPASSLTLYQIRAMRLTASGCGSYFNLSQGAYLEP